MATDPTKKDSDRIPYFGKLGKIFDGPDNMRLRLDAVDECGLTFVVRRSPTAKLMKLAYPRGLVLRLDWSGDVVTRWNQATALAAWFAAVPDETP